MCHPKNRKPSPRSAARMAGTAPSSMTARRKTGCGKAPYENLFSNAILEGETTEGEDVVGNKERVAYII